MKIQSLQIMESSFTDVNKNHLLCTAVCSQQEGRVNTLLYDDSFIMLLIRVNTLLCDDSFIMFLIRVNTLLYNAAFPCRTKDRQGCGLLLPLSFQTPYDNTNTRNLRALTLLSNSEPKHLEKQVQQTT